MEIVVGTPGRMEDLMNDNILRLNVSEMVILEVVSTQKLWVFYRYMQAKVDV